MKRVLIESPYSGNIDQNKAYAWDCVKDSLNRGEAPFASHLFYTEVLNDFLLPDRLLGMEAGFVWGQQAQLVAVYTDLGISPGMEHGIARAQALDIPVEHRSLTEWRNDL